MCIASLHIFSCSSLCPNLLMPFKERNKCSERIICGKGAKKSRWQLSWNPTTCFMPFKKDWGFNGIFAIKFRLFKTPSADVPAFWRKRFLYRFLQIATMLAYLMFILKWKKIIYSHGIQSSIWIEKKRRPLLIRCNVFREIGDMEVEGIIAMKSPQLHSVQ